MIPSRGAPGMHKRIIEFLFPGETDKWLAVLRIGLGLLVTIYTLFLWSDWHYLFASTGKGLLSRQLGEAMASFDSPVIPKLGWLVTLGGYAHIGEDAVLSISWACLLSMGLLLLLGIFCRQAAVIAWFLHLCAAESGGLFAYGADNFITTGLFYLMLSPLPDRYSLDHWFLKIRLKDASLLGFWRRVLQVQMCFVYFVGGLAKCLGSGWWNGSNLWLSLTRPPFNLISPDVLVRFKYALPIIGISICLIELGYPFFIWIKKTRLIWLICILAMHAVIGLAMGLYLFALVMIVFNLAAFGFGMSKGRTVATEGAKVYNGGEHPNVSGLHRDASPFHD